MPREISPLYRCVYALIRQVPPGCVTTYGRIGRRAGCTARTVGFALAALAPGSDVPWQRVVNRAGRISLRRSGEGDLLQRDLLEAEGVCFDRGQRIDLERYGWDFADSSDGPG